MTEPGHPFAVDPADLQRIVLVGHMGSGKTSVGRELARLIGGGAMLVDSDQLILEQTGRSAAAIIDADGVDAFRAAESAAILAGLRAPAQGLEIWSLGGGALTADDVFEQLRRFTDERRVTHGSDVRAGNVTVGGSHLVLWLDAETDELLQRVRDEREAVRPLARDPEEFGALHRERSERWTQASIQRIPTGGRTVQAIAAEIARAVAPAVSSLRTGPGSLAQLARDPQLSGVPVVVVADQAVAQLVDGIAVSMADAGAIVVDTLALPMGEWHKDLSTVETLLHRWADAGLTRDAVVIAVGGGTLLDTVGFAAASYLRGVSWISVPTTLLAQVDAGIGGKVAVNLDGRKNMVGAFHLPRTVVVDPDLLATLPNVELAAGWAELLKTLLLDLPLPAWTAIGDEITLAQQDRTGRELADLTVRSARIKDAVVRADPSERSGIRQRLNLGHTFAHAIESATDHGVAHGPAVAIGIHAALALSESQLGLDPAITRSWCARATQAGLPVGVDLPWEALATHLAADKKRVHGQQRWVLMAAPGEARTDQVVDAALVRELWETRIRSAQPTARTGRGGSAGAAPRVLVLFGVNLGELGRREAQHYGSDTLAALIARIEGWAAELGLIAVCRQTDSLARFLGAIHEAAGSADALIVNPGAWTHHERSLHDALSPLSIPVAEVHLSAIDQRPEAWRRISVIADVADIRVSGEGAEGYRSALASLTERLAQPARVE